MGWRGTLRSLDAAAKRAERSNERRQREAEKQRVTREVTDEVAEYERHVEQLVSLHKAVPQLVDWNSINAQNAEYYDTKVRRATSALANYSPSILERILFRVRRKTLSLRSELYSAKQEAKLFEISQGVVAGEARSLLDAVDFFSPFDDISFLGSEISISIDAPHCAVAKLAVHSKDVVPRQSKAQLKSGRLSVKDIPKTRFYALYQDHVCSSILRAGNELFALIPIDKIIITAVDALLNTKTGHMEVQPIVSIALVRTTMELLDLERLDPSDAMENFVHRMSFRRISGFAPVESLAPHDITGI